MACRVGGWGDVLRGRCPVSVHQPGSRLTHAQSHLQAEVGHPRGQLHSQLPRGTEGRPGRPSAACERPRPGRRRFSANSSRPTRSPAPPRVPTCPHAPPLGRGWLPDSAPRVAQLTPVLMAYVFQGLKCFLQTSFKILKRESTVQGTHPSRGLSRIKIWTYFLHYPIFLFFLSSLVGVLSKALGSSNASLKN